MKKITFFAYNMYQMGGIEKVVTLIANELSKKYDVEIISLYQTAELPFYKLSENIKVYSILKKELKPIKLYYLYLMYRVRKFLKDYNTDVFICAGTAYVPLNIFLRKRAKYIAWEHMDSSKGRVGGIMWLGRRVSAKYADNIVVLTKKDLEQNIRFFNDEEKLRQIYNPIELMPQQNDYDSNSKKILTVARIELDTKGYDMLVSVAHKVFAKHKEWEWHIYGDGPDFNKLKSLVHKNNLENNLKLMGRTNKMNELYSKYSFFVMTSRHEGFPMVNIEAHYAKLPIISFNCKCGPDEIIQDGVNGFLIECFDTEKMVEKINFLIENPDVRIRMSENTMLDKEKLQMENVIKEWERII